MHVVANQEKLTNLYQLENLLELTVGGLFWSRFEFETGPVCESYMNQIIYM